MRRIVLGLALVTVIGTAAAKPTEAPSAAVTLKPSADQTEAAIWAMRFLSRFHYKPTPLDDAMSNLLTRYLVLLWDRLPQLTQADLPGLAEAVTAMVEACIRPTPDTMAAADTELAAIRRAQVLAYIRRQPQTRSLSRRTRYFFATSACSFSGPTWSSSSSTLSFMRTRFSSVLSSLRSASSLR